MELKEKELENILGGANPAVIKKESANNDELDESQLENVQAGIYKQDLAEKIAEQNSSLYRQEMINKLNEEKDKILNEHPKSK